jgi:hypothetical protein
MIPNLQKIIFQTLFLISFMQAKPFGLIKILLKNLVLILENTILIDLKHRVVFLEEFRN